jgi:class 3 adenylate cyclase/tetratricopeptide (TPR) repeat protein
MQPDAATCPECGTAAPPSFHFCPTCGIRLVAVESSGLADAPAPRFDFAPEPETADAGRGRAERRLVSVMFIDLVGFTSLSEELDPEDVREVQSRYFEAARSTVARFEGSLEKFIGDAVMAVWGTPIARENDAERAVRAALELVRTIGAMVVGTPLGGRLVARAAVTTGEVAVAFDLVGEGMVTGDTVNTASRLQEAAEPGTVLADDATRRAIGVAGRFEPAGEKQLKGKAAPVRAWRALEIAGREGGTAAAGARGPFVGRVPEMAALQALVRSVQADRRTTLVSLTGIAGIGKSRLLRELEHATTAPAGPRWFHARPPRWGQGTAFAPIAEMVRRSIGVADGDPAEVIRRALGESLIRLIEDDAERAWMAPRLGVLLDPGERLETERDELFAAWRRFFEAEASAGAIAMALEDLQWADVETLDFIDYLATWSRRHPILIITVARPEMLEARPTWGAGIPQFRSMHIDRLNDGEVDELLSALAPSLPPEVAARVRQRAEGVPLYAVEIARMMAERLAERGEAVSVRDIPESLHALLSARIDALPERERGALLMAAVLGRRFRPEVLAALVGLDRRTLGDALGTLVRREFLALDDNAASPGRGQLSFVQDLMREVAYGTLSRRDRRRHHLAVIDQLQGGSDDEAVEPLAEHFVAAYAASRSPEDESQRIGERAIGALRQAADHAAAMHAPHRALGHLERALDLVSDPAQRAELAEAAAAAARAAARFPIAEGHLREAIDLRDALGDAPAATRHRAQLASLLLQAQRSDAALNELEQAWEAYPAEAERDAAQIHLATELARAYMLRGDTEGAIEWAGRAIAGAEASPDENRALVIDARISLGTALAQGGRPEDGLAELTRAIDDATRDGPSSAQLRARANLAWLKAGDDPRAAAEIASLGLQLAKQVGSLEWVLQLLDIAGFVAIDTGDWHGTIAQLDDLSAAELPSTYQLDFAAMRATIAALRGDADPLAAMERLGAPEPDLDPHALGWTESARAVASVVRGDLEGGLALAQSAAGRTVGLERVEALTLVGRIATWTANADAGAHALAELEAEAVWGRAVTARATTLRAALAAMAEPPDVTAADALWTEALAAWRDLGLPLREALTLLDRWVLRGDPADREEATRLLEALGARGLIGMLADAGDRLSARVRTWPATA